MKDMRAEIASLKSSVFIHCRVEIAPIEARRYQSLLCGNINLRFDNINH